MGVFLFSFFLGGGGVGGGGGVRHVCMGLKSECGGGGGDGGGHRGVSAL